MAVWQLAGPFDVRILGASPEDLLPFVEPVMWYPRVGFIGSLYWSGSAATLSVLALDGVVQDRAAFANNDQGLTYAGWWPARGRVLQIWNMMVDGVDTPVEMIYEPIAFARQTAQGLVATPGMGSHHYVRLPDRRVWYEPGYDGHMHGVVNGVDTIEGPLIPFNSGRVHPGRHAWEVFIAENRTSSDTRGVFYDAMTRQLSSPYYHIGMGCRMLVYAPEFGIMVSLHDTDSNPTVNPSTPQQVRIWSLEVMPALVTPVVPVYNAPQSGDVVQYQVQVTGNHQDVCAKELVAWSVTGSGRLLDMQTTTDDQGYAKVRVQYGVEETGSSLVEASVVC